MNYTLIFSISVICTYFYYSQNEITSENKSSFVPVNMLSYYCKNISWKEATFLGSLHTACSIIYFSQALIYKEQYALHIHSIKGVFTVFVECYGLYARNLDDMCVHWPRSPLCPCRSLFVKLPLTLLLVGTRWDVLTRYEVSRIFYHPWYP